MKRGDALGACIAAPRAVEKRGRKCEEGHGGWRMRKAWGGRARKRTQWEERGCHGKQWDGQRDGKESQGYEMGRKEGWDAHSERRMSRADGERARFVSACIAALLTTSLRILPDARLGVTVGGGLSALIHPPPEENQNVVEWTALRTTSLRMLPPPHAHPSATCDFHT